MVAKVNTDEEQDLAQWFGIMYIPTVIAFRGGKEALLKLIDREPVQILPVSQTGNHNSLEILHPGCGIFSPWSFSTRLLGSIMLCQ